MARIVSVYLDSKEPFVPVDMSLIRWWKMSQALVRLGPCPYPQDGRKRCVYSGNIYDPVSQPEAHRTLVSKLNGLGRELAGRGVRLFVIGPGETSRLDPEVVAHLGAVPYARSWDYLWHADAGLVLAFGQAMNHNESTKIYYYLRVGLPVVCEGHYPNEDLITQARLGRITPNGVIGPIAAAVEETCHAGWDRQHAMDLIVREHTWERRARIYDEWLSRSSVRGSGGTAPRSAPRSDPSGDGFRVDGVLRPRSAAAPPDPGPGAAESLPVVDGRREGMSRR